MKKSRAITVQTKVDAMGVSLRHVNLKFSLLWAVGVSTGLRIGDLLTLKVSHLQSSYVTLVEEKTKNTRSLKLLPAVFDFYLGFVFFERLSPDDFLFYSSRKMIPIKDKPMSRQWANRIIGRVARENGLEMICSHSMRKTYACKLFASERSVKAVQADLGHKFPSTTMIYLADLLENLIVD